MDVDLTNANKNEEYIKMKEYWRDTVHKIYLVSPTLCKSDFSAMGVPTDKITYTNSSMFPYSNSICPLYCSGSQAAMMEGVCRGDFVARFFYEADTIDIQERAKTILIYVFKTFSSNNEILILPGADDPWAVKNAFLNRIQDRVIQVHTCVVFYTMAERNTQIIGRSLVETTQIAFGQIDTRCWQFADDGQMLEILVNQALKIEGSRRNIGGLPVNRMEYCFDHLVGGLLPHIDAKDWDISMLHADKMDADISPRPVPVANSSGYDHVLSGDGVLHVYDDSHTFILSANDELEIEKGDELLFKHYLSHKEENHW